jgi:hypothetical protein
MGSLTPNGSCGLSMATLHVLKPGPDAAEDASLSDLICQPDLEREVFAVLRG